MKILNKIIEILLDFIIVIIVALIIIMGIHTYQTKILKKENSNIFGFTFFEVVTGSMADTLQIGDVIIIKITKDIEENDIIVYKKDDNFITHRVIEKNNLQIIVKGDANNSVDAPIKKGDVLGKVEFVIPKVGKIKNIMINPLMLLLLVSVIISTLIVCKSKTKNV